MPDNSYSPVFELTRGEITESIHNGAVAVVDVKGKLIAFYGDPGVKTYLRSTAKPLQLLSFLEHGGQAYYGLTAKEIALMCASHSGTDEHVSVAQGIQSKTGVCEADLLCGVHYPTHEATADRLRERGEQPTPNRHNCSGKHTGMLAYAKMIGQYDGKLPYIDTHHPVQQSILHTISETCSVEVQDINIGIDGCSAPNFAVPLQNTALAFARLCDPEGGAVARSARVQASHTICAAMMEHPLMVGGPGSFDSCLMEVARDRLVSKGGAEGYQGIGLLSGAVTPDSPAIGIAIKIGDGDHRRRIRSAVALEVLRQVGALTSPELLALSEFGPVFPIYNWRNILVGEGRPVFTLKRPAP